MGGEDRRHRTGGHARPTVHAARGIDGEVLPDVDGGNVALDVARILSLPAERLAATDMAEHALRALAASAVRTVHIAVRGAPAQASFTPRELRDLVDLDGVGVQLHLHGTPIDTASEADRRVSRNLQLITGLADGTDGERATLHLHFGLDTVQLDANEDGRVRGIRFRTRDEEELTIACGLVVRAIGYRSLPLPGLPFDPSRHLPPSRDGRLVDEAGRPQHGEYVTGWFRRGPKGIIGTNKVDAQEVVERILIDLADTCAGQPDLMPRLAERTRVVTADDWDRLRREERLRGSRVGRVAVRRVDADALLASLEEAAPLAGGPCARRRKERAVRVR